MSLMAKSADLAKECLLLSKWKVNPYQMLAAIIVQSMQVWKDS